MIICNRYAGGAQYASASTAGQCTSDQTAALNTAKRTCCTTQWPAQGNCESLNCAGECLNQLTSVVADCPGEF